MIQKYIILQTFVSFVLSSPSEVLLQNRRRRIGHSLPRPLSSFSASFSSLGKKDQSPLSSCSASISSLEKQDQSQSVQSLSMESVNKVPASKKVSRSTEPFQISWLKVEKTVTEDNVEKVTHQPRMKTHNEIIDCKTLETPNFGHYKMGVNVKDKYGVITYQI